MRKPASIQAAVILLVLLAGSVGCGKEATPGPTTSPTPTATLVPKPSPTGPPTFSTLRSPTLTPTPTRAPVLSPTATVVATPTVTPVTTATPTAATPGPTEKTITIELVASGIKYNTGKITVPAGALVTVSFKNDDAGILHNFSVYEKLPGNQTRPVFIGTTIIGPGVTVYSFPAPPASGSYFYDCDVHPDIMYEDFVVGAP